MSKMAELNKESLQVEVEGTGDVEYAATLFEDAVERVLEHKDQVEIEIQISGYNTPPWLSERFGEPLDEQDHTIDTD